MSSRNISLHTKVVIFENYSENYQVSILWPSILELPVKRTFQRFPPDCGYSLVMFVGGEANMGSHAAVT